MVEERKGRFTAEETLEKGAIQQPGSGMKGDDERCLTCIEYNRACHGKGIDQGRCETCRGLDGKGQKRKCFWLEDGVTTYVEARLKAGAHGMAKNTTS